MSAVPSSYLGAFQLADGPPPRAEVEAAAELDDLVVALARRAGRETEAAVRALSAADLETALSAGSGAAQGTLAQALEAGVGGAVAAGLELAALLGMLHVERLAAEAGAIALSDYAPPGVDEPLVFEEAVEALRARIGVLPQGFYALADALRFRAFTVSAVSSGDAVLAIQDALAAAIERGETFASFAEAARAAGGALDAAGVGALSPWRWETIFRTNATAASAAGRWTQIRELGDAVVALEYVTIEDTRTTTTCAALSGLVAAVGSDVWRAYLPPNHHACRSTVRPVFAGTAEAAALPPTPPDRIAALPAPADGFDASPVDPAAFYDLPAPLRRRAVERGQWPRVVAFAASLGVKIG